MRKLLVIPIAIVLVSGAATAGSLLDRTPMPPTDLSPVRAWGAPLHPQMPGFHSTRETVVGEGLRINNQLVDLSQFITDEAPDVVADHYEESFRRLRAEVNRYSVGPVTHVSTFADDGRMLSVMIIDEAEGTQVIPGVSEGTVRAGAELDESDIPMPPAPQLLLTHESTDGGKRATTAQFVVSQNLAEVLAFYRTELPRMGYRELGLNVQEGLEGARQLRFRRGAAMLTVTVHGMDDVGAMVYVLLERPLSREGP